MNIAIEFLKEELEKIRVYINYNDITKGELRLKHKKIDSLKKAIIYLRSSESSTGDSSSETKLNLSDVAERSGQLECNCPVNNETLEEEVKQNRCFSCGLPIVAR